MAININFSDCTFNEALISASNNFAEMNINYCVFTDNSIDVSAAVSAIDTSAVSFNHCTYDWDLGGQTYPELSAINKTNIRFIDYGLSSTSADRSSTWETSAYNTGFWQEDRLGAGAWNFNQTGHIGAFYFGDVGGVDITVEPLEITLTLPEPTIVIGESVTVTPDPLNIFISIPTPTIYSYEDVVIDFTGDPLLGTSPLDVDFTANVRLLGDVEKNYRITTYEWYYDWDRDTSLSAATTLPTTEYTFSGYEGKQFSVKLDVTLTHKVTAATITRGLLKKNYITICGRAQPVRYGAARDIDLVSFLPDYLQTSQTYDFIKEFENYLNEMYTGTKGYVFSAGDY